MRFILLVILLLNKALSGRLATGISGRERIGIGGRFMQEYACWAIHFISGVPGWHCGHHA